MKEKNKRMLGFSSLLITLIILGCCLLLVGAVVVFRFIPNFDNLTRSTEVENVDDFYTLRSGGDFRVVPLIPPYQALSIDNQTWAIKLQTDSIRYQVEVHDIKKLAVVSDDMIISYSRDTLFGGQEVDELWFVFEPSRQTETGFTSRAELVKFLNERGVENYQEEDLESLYSELLSTGTLYWFP